MVSTKFGLVTAKVCLMSFSCARFDHVCWLRPSSDGFRRSLGWPRPLWWKLVYLTGSALWPLRTLMVGGSIVMAAAVERPIMVERIGLSEGCLTLARHTLRLLTPSDSGELPTCPRVAPQLPNSPTVARKFPQRRQRFFHFARARSG